MKKFLILVVISIILFGCNNIKSNKDYIEEIKPITNKLSKPYYDPVIQTWTKRYYIVYSNGKKDIQLLCKNKEMWEEAKEVRVMSNGNEIITEIMR